ncbi:MAG: hypothetical protein AAF438_23590, partial [Pseudomonadota bacterium]
QLQAQSSQKPEMRQFQVRLSLQYRPGWGSDKPFSQALSEAWARDTQRKTTTVGPQRAELVLLAEGMPAQGRISRGQQKLAASSLILAQLQHLEAMKPQNTILLLDDPAAELDNQSLSRFLSLVAKLDTQLFVTALRREDLPQSWQPQQLFHVKHGSFRESQSGP